MNRQTEGGREGGMDGQMDGWTNEQTDGGREEGWMTDRRKGCGMGSEKEG